jgi:hypothetical protein
LGHVAFDINSTTEKWGAVARCHANQDGSRHISPSECEANARLIAAAPDLLAACNVAIAAYDAAKLEGISRWLGTEVDTMREAIAKATDY